MKKLMLLPAFVAMTAAVAFAQNNTATKNADKPATSDTVTVRDKVDPISPNEFQKALTAEEIKQTKQGSSKGYKLDDTQLAYVKKQYDIKTKKENDIQRDAALTAEQKNQKRVEAKRIYVEDIKRVLDANQKTVLDAILAKEKPTAATSKMPPLTEAQRKKMQEVIAKYQEKIKALRSNTSLSPEAMREQMQALIRQQTLEIQSIMTPEQGKANYDKVLTGKGSGEKKDDKTAKPEENGNPRLPAGDPNDAENPKDPNAPADNNNNSNPTPDPAPVAPSGE